MFNLVRVVLKFWFSGLLLAVLGYGLMYNHEPIQVIIPHVGTYTLLSGVVFIGCIFLGVTGMTLYFLGDTIRRSLELKRYRKRIRQLEKQVGELQPAEKPANKKSWFFNSSEKKEPNSPILNTIDPSDRESAGPGI